MIYLVCAVSENNVIGKNNRLPWKIPSDLRWFKMNTYGGAVIMGRKTFESCGALPGRRNIVISRRPKPTGLTNVEWYNHIAIALSNVKHGYIIGGAEIYEATLKYVDAMIITRVHKHVQGDTFFEPPQGHLVWSHPKKGFTFSIYKL